jgi:DNA-binding winged helix-turn-helix (wHTH) protein/tetratricopeptide (TPR) repeat protein
MSSPAPPFRLGSFEIEPALNEVRGPGRSRSLEPKAMDLLVLLAQRAGETVGKEEILEEVWGGAFVTDGVVAKNVSALRSALEDDSRQPRYIVTVARRGYRLVAPVEWAAADLPPAESNTVVRARPPMFWMLAVVATALLASVAAVASLWPSPRREPLGPARPTVSSLVDPLAHRDFLRAHWLWQRRGMDDLQRAHTLFVAATERDPAFGEAFGGLAQCLVTLGSYGLLPRDEAWRRAAQAADRALVLNPNSPEGLTARGLVRYQRDWDFAGAATDFERAVAATAGPTPARQFLAEAQVALGRSDEAVSTIDAAIALEPYSPLLLAVKALVLDAAGRHTEALASIDDALDFEPRFYWHYIYQDFAFQRLGRPREAAWARARRKGGPTVAPDLAAAAAGGLVEVYRWEVRHFTTRAAQNRQGARFQLAESLAGLGRREEALSALEEALTERGEHFHILRSPAFDALRSDPGFRDLVLKNGLGAVAGLESRP